MEIIQDIDFEKYLEKYHTFFLEYYKFPSSPYQHHLLRPSTATYEEITGTENARVYTLEGALMTFNSSESLSQIVFECSIAGISIDFIDILVPDPEKSIERWDDNKIFQIIDLHKDDITKHIDLVDAPRFYVTQNVKKKDVLTFLVIDRISQSPDINFLNGKYDVNAVRAGFTLQQEAYEMCKKLNDESKT